MSLNNELSAAPASCDVLVVGAGPAGSAAARTLAQAGIDVVQIDQYAFPRDKICGDALIPDAHHALRKLGLLDEVMKVAHPVTHVGCIGSRGGRIDVPGTLAVLPRKQLDELLVRAAVHAGVRFFAPVRFLAPLVEDGRVVGARVQGSSVGAEEEASQTGSAPSTREIRARWVILATGASSQTLIAADVCERQTPSGMALRGYVKNAAMAQRIQAIEVVWHRSLTPGYGWIFPCGPGVFNIGVGLAHSHNRPGKEVGRGAKQDFNLREVFAAFVQFYQPARELMAGGTLLGALKGAPLRCTLEGARYTRAGMLVAGEAAGSTYSFTGEGIGKALETGALAAEAILSARNGSEDSNAQVLRSYEDSLAALKPRFLLYEKANKVNRHPWLSDLLIWRARRSPRVLSRMSGVLEETSNPASLVSVRGLFKLLGE